MLVRDFNLGCSDGMSKAKGPNVDSGFQPSGSKVAWIGNRNNSRLIHLQTKIYGNNLFSKIAKMYHFIIHFILHLII